MDREYMKRRIIELIDESRDNDRKIGFYSDENVQQIMNRLYGKWEENGRKGIPLDYATIEELEILYRLARTYTENPRGRAYVEFVRKAYFGEDKGKDERRNSWLRRMLRII